MQSPVEVYQYDESSLCICISGGIFKSYLSLRINILSLCMLMRFWHWIIPPGFVILFMNPHSELMK